MQKKYIFIFWIIFLLSVANSTYANTFIEKKINGTTIRYIDYDLSSNDYDIHIAYTPDPTYVRDLTLEYNGVTGVNGVFFCPADYSECGGKTYTINEHYQNGEKTSGIYDSTGDRVVFWWTKDKVPMLYQTDKINKGKEWDIYEWFANHPLLLKDGENMLEYWYDSYLVIWKLKDKSTRNFICSDKEKKHIYFWLVYNVWVDDEIPALVWIWCSDALNLDAGDSTSFVYNGRYMVGPGRKILDAVVIERKWLDVKEIDTKAKNMIDAVVSKLANKTSKVKENLLSKVSKALSSVRVKIYEENSIDTYDWSGNLDGYKIEIKDLNTLKKVYYINSLNYYIGKQLKNL